MGHIGFSYSSFWGIPVAGATLPVLVFLLLGIYGQAMQHRRQLGETP